MVMSEYRSKNIKKTTKHEQSKVDIRLQLKKKRQHSKTH